MSAISSCFISGRNSKKKVEMKSDERFFFHRLVRIKEGTRREERKVINLKQKVLVPHIWYKQIIKKQ